MKADGKDVTVTLKEFAGQDEQLTQQLALDFSTGAGADVSGFDGFLIPSFVEGGLLKPLDEIGGAAVAEWEGWQHISPGIRALMSYQGKDYGIALGTDTRMIFVRKDLFEKAGLDADAWEPTSWADVLDAARAIKQAAPDSFPLQLNAGVSMGEATTMQGYWMALLGTGEGVIDENGKWIVASQGILDTLNLYKTIYVDEGLGDQRAQLLGDGRNRTFANFRDDKTAMLVEGDWFYREVTAPGSEFEVADRDGVMTWKKMPAEAPGKGIRGQDFVTDLRRHRLGPEPEHRRSRGGLGAPRLHERQGAARGIPDLPARRPRPRRRADPRLAVPDRDLARRCCRSPPRARTTRTTTTSRWRSSG